MDWTEKDRGQSEAFLTCWRCSAWSVLNLFMLETQGGLLKVVGVM